jgi:phosphopantothenoylcysteine decarboxylase/phosphopantothenate--cysteine ligase
MRILITASATREYIDPVRFISNASSGRMGYELARAAGRLGHEVIIISGPSKLKRPIDSEIIYVETSEQMFDAVKNNFTWSDCLIMAAAVADYRPLNVSSKKLKKTGKTLTINLTPVADILQWAGKNKRKGQFVTGFALEDTNLKKNAEQKLTKKNADMIVANKPITIGSDNTSVHVKIQGQKWIDFGLMTKKAAANRIIRLIEKNYEQIQKIP